MDNDGPPAFLKGLIIGIAAAAVLGGLLFFLLFPLALTHRSSWPLEDAIGTNRVLAAVPAAYKRMENPLTADVRTTSEGRTVYLGNCSVCHGPKGTGDSPIGRNMYPPAADLSSQRVIGMRDGEIAWIVKSGLSFVGMPAFRTILSDRQVWQVVTFIRSLHAAGAAAEAPAPAPTAVSSEDLARGRELFAEKGCANCHGRNAEGGVGPALSGIPLPLDSVLRKIRRGGGGMPAFDKGTVSDAEAEQIYRWLESRP
jgi:mono/diheme cytochrome c family protein